MLVIMAACSKDSSGGSSGSSSDGSKNGSSKDEKVEIRFTWWGDTSRNEVYNEIVDRFEEEHPNITVKREFGGWEEYWDKLATQIAGGNAPDVVSMHQFYVSDYARRNALYNLNQLVDSQNINLSDFPESAVDSGKVDGNIFMVAQGLTMPGYAFNTALFDELGIDYPEFDWTWEDMAEKAAELKQAIGDEKKWGLVDSSGAYNNIFRYFTRQRGKDLFTEDGKVGYDKEDVVAWWSMWDDLRKKNLIPDAATGNEFANAPLEANMFVTGVTAIGQFPANQINLYQEQFDNGEIQMVRVPTMAGAPNGEYIEGAYLSISEKSKHPEEAAMFIDFFINSEKAVELFKVQQGPPAGTKMSTLVMDLIDPAEARAVEFIQKTVPLGRPAPYAPAGNNEVVTAFEDNAEAIAYGQKTVEQAAEDFMKQAESILQ
ncbi:sugar ABC transporter substrate-binding protein [Bacillus sp. FJAT-49711]|nr:sugar ABC transporter substrate-binding protein [Bacillus sp. FJAT-49711]MBS4219509.1 sugar ABC transporter substrate-binding protein [Bacillus sp. FJAT-49711]